MRRIPCAFFGCERAVEQRGFIFWREKISDLLGGDIKKWVQNDVLHLFFIRWFPAY